MGIALRRDSLLSILNAVNYNVIWSISSRNLAILIWSSLTTAPVRVSSLWLCKAALTVPRVRGWRGPAENLGHGGDDPTKGRGRHSSSLLNFCVRQIQPFVGIITLQSQSRLIMTKSKTWLDTPLPLLTLLHYLFIKRFRVVCCHITDAAEHLQCAQLAMPGQ